MLIQIVPPTSDTWNVIKTIWDKIRARKPSGSPLNIRLKL